MVRDPALESADVDGAVELAAVAPVHAEGRADAPADPRQGRGASEHARGGAGVVAGHRLHEADDVVASRADRRAGRETHREARHLRAPGPGPQDWSGTFDVVDEIQNLDR